MLPAHAATLAPTCDATWSAWSEFQKKFISAEGGVIDNSAGDTRASSEGQAYALFFALVANDKKAFEKILAWTEENLADDDLATHLPAANWGKSEETWGATTDTENIGANLWMAYALGEAGRLWTNRRYVALSSLMADRILSTETLNMPKLGLVLAANSSVAETDRSSVYFNPSHMPLQLLHWFAARSNDKRWGELLTSSRQIILGASPKGYAPDWIKYDFGKGFIPSTDEEKSSQGGQQAIRVYLWAGMLNRDDADRADLLEAFKQMARFVENQGAPPASIDTRTGAADELGSSGFSAALIPLLQTTGLTKAAEAQRVRSESQPIAEKTYFDQVLSLYALGWRDNLYRFDSKGTLTPRWTSTCK